MKFTKVTLQFPLPVGTRTLIVDTYANGSAEAILTRCRALKKKGAILEYKCEEYIPDHMSLETFIAQTNGMLK